MVSQPRQDAESLLVPSSRRWDVAAEPHSGPACVASIPGYRWPQSEVDVKPKVFHVITKLELGGAQKVVLTTLERLPRDRYELALVTGPEGLLVDWAKRIPGLSCVWIPDLIREVRPIEDIRAFFYMWRLFRRERPQVVHTHSSKAGILGRWAARLAGVPFIFHTVHG